MRDPPVVRRFTSWPVKAPLESVSQKGLVTPPDGNAVVKGSRSQRSPVPGLRLRHSQPAPMSCPDPAILAARPDVLSARGPLRGARGFARPPDQELDVGRSSAVSPGMPPAALHRVNPGEVCRGCAETASSGGPPLGSGLSPLGTWPEASETLTEAWPHRSGGGEHCAVPGRAARFHRQSGRRCGRRPLRGDRGPVQDPQKEELS